MYLSWFGGGCFQSFVMFIRHVSEAKNTVADWLSRMHAYISCERIELLSAGHADVSCLMGCLLEYPGMRVAASPAA